MSVTLSSWRHTQNTVSWVPTASPHPILTWLSFLPVSATLDSRVNLRKLKLFDMIFLAQDTLKPLFLSSLDVPVFSTLGVRVVLGWGIQGLPLQDVQEWGEVRV